MFESESYPDQKVHPAVLLVSLFAVHTIFQAWLHSYVAFYDWGSLPTLQYIFITLIYFYLFIYLWTGLPCSTCVFVALIFLLTDNCVWPMLSGLSRLFWGGVNYLYEGRYLLRIPYIALFCLLESTLMLLIRRLLPLLREVRIDRYNRVLMISSIVPFLYIRVISSQQTAQVNKSLQVVMTVCCLVGLVTMVGGIGRTSQELARIESERMKHALQNQQQQFQMKLETIEEVNRKYHDMKNILLYLNTAGENPDLQKEIGRLLGTLKPYEAILSTGNEAIDVIVNEKLMLCQEKGITCVPYIDGSLFQFIDGIDLCTIFGNALDNAIESCEQIPDEKDRQLSIKAVQKGDTLILAFRNTFAQEPSFHSGLPVTTKEDRESHGYGPGNIRLVAQKYRGELACRVENEEFVLTLLFPMPGQEQKSALHTFTPLITL
ncbi:MAG: ATP-binding protein [Lachnospiraceae bacterium]|nr:ATP-binding protein [Lachnospiraceae bacterium]